MNHGIKDLKEIVIFFCRFGNAVDASLEDGKVSITDATNFYKPLKAIPDAYDGASNAFVQFKDMDAVEKKELVDTVVLELDLTFDVVEEIIEEIISSALDFYLNYKKISTLIKTKKKKR